MVIRDFPPFAPPHFGGVKRSGFGGYARILHQIRVYTMVIPEEMQLYLKENRPFVL